MSNARVGDIERRLANLIRPGTVLQADYAKARIKVALGKNETAWIPWLTSRAGGDRTWHAPEVGEQVLVVAPSGELAAGFVLPGSIFKTDYPANGDTPEVSRTTFKDGAVIEYDREAHAHKAEIPAGGSATVKVGAQATSVVTDAAITHTVGGAVVTITAASISLAIGGTTLTLSGAGIVITGPVTQTGGNLTSDGIGLQTHLHGGVTSGPSTTAGPVP